MDKLITVDGPSGVGKGTASRSLAATLNWEWLDSGALYRLVAYQVLHNNIADDDIDKLVDIAAKLDVRFDINNNDDEPIIWLGDENVTLAIRTETCSQMASKISAHLAVRAALLQRQRDFFTEKGLVTDGRDMGTVVFPNASVKFYLTASAEVRAQRRQKQLQQQGINVNMRDLLREIQSRDERDSNRSVAPMRPAEDAIIIDTLNLSIEQVHQEMMKHVVKRGLGG